MSEKTFDLPEGVEEDGQTWWGPYMASVITTGDGQVYIDDTVCGEYSAERVEQFALALLAAVEVSRATTPTESS